MSKTKSRSDDARDVQFCECASVNCVDTKHIENITKREENHGTLFIYIRIRNRRTSR